MGFNSGFKGLSILRVSLDSRDLLAYLASTNMHRGTSLHIYIMETIQVERGEKITTGEEKD